MPFTDDVITATSQLTVTDGAGGPVFADLLPAAGKAYVTGRLGLGTINPQNKLDVEGAMAVGAAYSGTSAAPADGLLVEGNVGIGTTAPGAKLDVAGTLKVGQNAQFMARVGIGVAAPQNALDVEGALAVGAAYSGTILAPVNGLVVEGNVGIGTSAPIAKLQIAGGAFMPSAGNSTTAGILFPQNPAGGAGDTAWIRYYARAGESMTLEIGVANDVDDHIALMASGNVGIGTDAPTAKLDVAGTARVGGNLTVTGALYAGRSDLYFTNAAHNHTGAGNTAGHAAIENAADYGALMILGRAGTDVGRKVRLWDYLSVEGPMAVQGDVAIRGKHAFRGSDPWLRLNQDGAFTSGVHTPGNFAPGALNVGGVNGWGNPGFGNMWIAGQINKLDIADNFTAIVRCGDFCMGHSGRRGSPGRALVDYKDAATGNTLRINYGGDWTGGCRYYISMDRASSRKFKKDIEDLKGDTARDIVERLNPVTFRLKREDQPASYLGFIAEDVPPEVGAPDREAVNTDHIVAALTRVVKDQQHAIAELRTRIEHLSTGARAVRQGETF